MNNMGGGMNNMGGAMNNMGGGMSCMMQQQSQTPMLGGQRVRGMVKSYSESNGYGFIGGEEVLTCVGKDVFLHQREVSEVTGIARPQVPIGAVVTFTVTVNPKGQPQARELRFEDQSFLQMQQLGDAALPNQNFANQYAQGGKRFTGFVRSFSQINGFGFVGGDEISHNFGKDVFLHFRELAGLVNDAKPSLPTGTWLTFTVTLNQKGQPQARDVQFEPGTVLPLYQQAQLQNEAADYQVCQTAAMNPGWTNPALLAQQGENKMSDADAYARVQADIAKFQAQVAALREANTKVERSRSRSRSRRSRSKRSRNSRSKRSRSPKAPRDEEGDLDGNRR